MCKLVVPEILVFAPKLLLICRGGGSASREASLFVRNMCSRWGGGFLTMQCCLDVAVCSPPLFSRECVDVGPGCVEDLWQLFPGQGSGETGMIRKRSAQVTPKTN